VRFSGKTAIVTGSAGGIGESYAKALAAEGADVVVADLEVAGAERVAAEIADRGGSAFATRVDVSEQASADAMAQAACEAFGGIDLLVNNAAIYAGMRLDPLTTIDLDYFEHFMRVNAYGVLHCTRACHQSMIERGGGAIVNQSSTAAWMAAGHYSVAKATVNALTASLAAQLGGRGIRVNAIAPGPTDTAATRQVVPEEYQGALVANLAIKRMGTPDDLVGALIFLLSDDAAWLTGQIVSVDGGQIVRI
jgi:3-oxoacyl-[acyl-carrier protein] reductase